MDGKKRIARLRNAEKWKKLGFGAFFKAAKQLEAAAKKAKGVKAGELKLMVVGQNIPQIGETYFDHWNCEWKKRKPPIPGVFGSHQRVIEKLTKKGFKHLGSGHYSTVMAHPKSDKVIKITRHQDNWIDYVKWAAENGYAGGFAPRVYSWKKFPAGWSWAVMERMEHTVGGDYGDFSYPGDDPSETKDDDYEIIFSLLNLGCRGNTMAKVYCEDLCPGAIDFVTKLRSVMRASDIRGPNTMVRKDGSLCFTDPCAGSSKLTTTRLKSRDFGPSAVWRYYEKNLRLTFSVLP